MSKKKDTSNDNPIENIETTLTKSEQFIEKNQKKILYVITALVLIVGLYWAYVKFYKAPRENEAKTQIAFAQRAFEQDSFNLALNGNMNSTGFLGVIDDYSGTKAANLARYYAGVCYMNLGDYDNAINYLDDFSTDDLLLGSEKYGMIGDAYVQKDMLEEAAKYYEKATSDDYKNDLTTPIYLKKLGLVYERLGKYDKAYAAYEKIYKEHHQSQEAITIEKYMERAKIHINK